MTSIGDRYHANPYKYPPETSNTFIVDWDSPPKPYINIVGGFSPIEKWREIWGIVGLHTWEQMDEWLKETYKSSVTFDGGIRVRVTFPDEETKFQFVLTWLT